MSDSLSAQLLREMNDALTESEDENEDETIIIGKIEVKFTRIPGLRSGSSLIWAYEERNLYYRNSYSAVTRIEACKCYTPSCNARLYIREDGTAYRRLEHDRAHGSMYNEFKEKYCFNRLKEKAESMPASVTPFEIYQQVVSE